MENVNSSDLPFLVTHWLSNYGENSRIRELGSELARAFGEQGAFGTAASTSFSSHSSGVPLQHRSARYEDVSRRWNGLSGDHLEAVVHAGARASRVIEQQHQLTTTANNTHHIHNNNALTILHKPVLLSTNTNTNNINNNNINTATTTLHDMRTKCVTALKRATDLKLQCRAGERELRQIQSSMAIQDKLRLDLEESKMPSTLEEEGAMKAKELEVERVTSHLQLRRSVLLQKQTELELTFQKEDARSKELYATLQKMQRLHVDGSDININNNINNNKKKHVNLLHYSTITRPQHWDRTASQTLHTAKLLQRKTLLQRLRHTLTINCHLYYPVYCLKFDKTRRYFITGADDHLAKIFYVGGYTPPEHNQHTTNNTTNTSTTNSKKSIFSYTNGCGAVLVATLRGHNGVVTDMDVSCDNMLVATASEDGSVRVWGLKNGACVAVLRHCGGVNMVRGLLD